MSVKLCYRAALEELTGRREEYIEARAVSEALSHIKRLEHARTKTTSRIGDFTVCRK